MDSGAFELLDALAQFVDFVADRGERFGERIVDLLGIDNDDAFAFAQDDVARDLNYGGIIGNVAQDDGSGADAAVFSDGDVAKNLCAARESGYRSRATESLISPRSQVLAPQEKEANAKSFNPHMRHHRRESPPLYQSHPG